MKVIFEVLLSVFLHPIAFILMIFNVLGRKDLTGLKKAGWLLVGWIWGIGPLLYVFLGDGSLW